ncbi:hypothetical protein C8R44DRAFT_872072 [Mycena epipterygia]|nr:hypothetical protein C8R44DRAFT_872072 [Mycena epipterygia]
MSKTASRAVQDPIAAAISARVDLLPFSMTEPLAAEEVWDDAEAATDEQRAALIHAARYELNSRFHLSMDSQDNAIGAYEAIQHRIFAHTNLRRMIGCSEFKVDTKDTDAVVGDLFLSYVGILRRSLSDADFDDWFKDNFQPLIETGDLAFNNVDEDSDSDSEDEGGRSSKRTRMQPERKYARAYELLRQLRQDQPEFKLKQKRDEPAEEVVKLVAAGSIPRSPVQEDQDRGHRHVRKRDNAQCRSTIVLRTSTYFRRTISGLLSQAVSSTVSAYSAFPSVTSFAPRLNPRPLVMPGSWPSPRPLVSLRPDTAPVFSRPTRHQITHEYSRFAKRPTSSSYTIHHICQLNP